MLCPRRPPPPSPLTLDFSLAGHLSLKGLSALDGAIPDFRHNDVELNDQDAHSVLRAPDARSTGHSVESLSSAYGSPFTCFPIRHHRLRRFLLSLSDLRRLASRLTHASVARHVRAGLRARLRVNWLPSWARGRRRRRLSLFTSGLTISSVGRGSLSAYAVGGPRPRRHPTCALLLK